MTSSLWIKVRWGLNSTCLLSIHIKALKGITLEAVKMFIMAPSRLEVSVVAEYCFKWEKIKKQKTKQILSGLAKDIDKETWRTTSLQ